jgi:hypothetical protein
MVKRLYTILSLRLLKADFWNGMVSLSRMACKIKTCLEAASYLRSIALRLFEESR